MSWCVWCEQEMSEPTKDCIGNVVRFPDGTLMDAVPNNGGRCGDCGVASGGRHHPGCDMEKCPRCRGQLISCGCLDEEEK
jgi:hypothetical protein